MRTLRRAPVSASSLSDSKSPNGQPQPRREALAEQRRLHAVLGAHSNLNS